jgi:hypothetical protein
VSSSGHLIVVPWLFGWTVLEDAGIARAFDAGKA